VNQLEAEWEIVFYADAHGREPVREWMEDLSKQKRMALEEAISVVLAALLPNPRRFSCACSSAPPGRRSSCC